MGVVRLARLREEDHTALLPETWSIAETEARPVDNAENVENIGGKVQEKNGLEAIGARSFLRLKVSNGLLDRGLINDSGKLRHNSIRRSRSMVIPGEAQRGGLREVRQEEEVRCLTARAG